MLLPLMGVTWVVGVLAVNADMVATERGLKLLEEHSKEPTDFTSLLKLRAITKRGTEHTLAGTVYRGRPRLVRFEGFGVDFVPEGLGLVSAGDR